MATATTKGDKIRQIVRLKQFVQRWKNISLRRRHSPSTTRRAPSGFVAVYVGPERRRFLIPTHFLNLPVFVDLLKETEEEFGFDCSGGLVLPCDVAFFKQVLEYLKGNERRFGGLRLNEFLGLFSEMGFDSFCRDDAGNAACHAFTPLLQKARV